MTKKQTVLSLMLGAATIPAAIYAWNKFSPPKPVLAGDKLCSYVVSQQQMKCVTVLATDAYMKPGSIVEYQDSTARTDARVPLPVADLLDETCVIPGSPVLRAAAAPRRAISLPQLTYENNILLSEGADVNVPKLRELQFKAGPNWSDVSKVELVNESAWANNLDELVALNAYQSCHIRKVCTDYIAKRRYSVVQTTIVAEGLRYKVYNRNNELVSLDAGVKSGQFSASVGGSTDFQSSADSTISATEPRVVGVRLLPGEVFAQRQGCEGNVAFDPPSGTSRVRIEGLGGRGNVGRVEREAPIGINVDVTRTGAEVCSPDSGCSRSEASAKAMIKAVIADKLRDEGPGLEFSYDIRAKSGHAHTASNPAVPTTAVAKAELTASLPILVRSEDVERVVIVAENLPSDTTVEVFEKDNQKVELSSDSFINEEKYGNETRVTQVWRAEFAVTRLGVYRLDINVTQSVEPSIQEVQTAQKKSTSTVRVRWWEKRSFAPAQDKLDI